MIELHLDTGSFGRENVKELMGWVNTTRSGRYGTIDVLWNRTDLLIRFYDEADVLAFKLTFDYEKHRVR